MNATTWETGIQIRDDHGQLCYAVRWTGDNLAEMPPQSVATHGPHPMLMVGPLLVPCGFWVVKHFYGEMHSACSDVALINHYEVLSAKDLTPIARSAVALLTAISDTAILT